MESGLSLSNIGGSVREQLRRLDIASGEEYLTGVTSVVEPLQERLDAARDELGELIAQTKAAKDTAELRIVNDRTVSAAQALFVSIHSVPMVQELCTAVRDAIAERALELSRRELYFSGTYCKLPLSLLAVGSDGRREQLLFTDQDYLFLYGSGEKGSPRSEEQIADYFGMLGAVFMKKLEEAGIDRCSGGIMPVNDEWRGTMEQWRQRLNSMFRFERNDWQKSILNLIALMDARLISGDRELGLGFGTLVRSTTRDNTMAMRNMAQVVSAMRLSKGFLRRFIVEAEGPHMGDFNLKVFAWMPLVMCIRLLAVYFGVEETSTLKRINLLRREGFFSDRMAADLADAYHVITGHRVLQQIKRQKKIIDDDCYINPYELQNQEREELRKAIGSIEELQNMIRRRFWIAKEVDSIINPRR
ncbi:MAG: nucleotidyltransferase [Deltaproteobacteria bacterium]|nr:nucleotidyltransferase [Deltaproteobacteria bacterium]